MTGRPRVLLVGHDASRTGAPIVARSFLRWLVASEQAEPAVLLLREGPLAAELAALAPCRTAARTGPELLDGAGAGLAALGRSGAALHRAATRVRARSSDGSFDLVVANTLAAWPTAVAVGGERVVCWVHELDHVADQVLAGQDRHRLSSGTSHFVAAGPQVREMLVARWGEAPSRVTTVDEFVDPLAPSAASGPTSDTTRTEILGVGSAVPRKGLDAFIATVAALSREQPAVRARWVGAEPAGPLTAAARLDLAAAGLTDRVRIDPPTDRTDHWSTAAVLLHPAREDPFPLAVLEAGQRGIPVVTWRTGGAADLLTRAGCADLVVPAGDLLGLARCLAALLADDGRRQAAGAALRAEVEAHHLIATGAPAVWAAVTGTGR